MNHLLLNCIVTTYLLVMAPVSSTIYSKIRSYTSALYFFMHSPISKLEYRALSDLVVRSQNLLYGVQTQIWRDPAELFGRTNGGLAIG